MPACVDDEGCRLWSGGTLLRCSNSPTCLAGPFSACLSNHLDLSTVCFPTPPPPLLPECREACWLGTAE
eukprot:366478-Chlamydomonas_euryale.AAC.4